MIIKDIQLSNERKNVKFFSYRKFSKLFLIDNDPS